MKNPNRVAAGLRIGHHSKDSGQDFEDFCAEHHNEALRLGILTHWVHNEPHWRQVGGQWIRVQAGVADVTGILHNKVATTLATEMKKRKNRLRRNEIEPKQAQHLDAVVRGGGLAFLLARIVVEGAEHDFAAPWQLVPWRVVKTAESVGVDELAPWVIPKDCRCYLDKYCSVRGVPVSLAKRIFPRE